MLTLDLIQPTVLVLMVIYLRLQPDLKSRVDSLVKGGLYPDFNSAAVTALENLVVVEEEHGRSQSQPFHEPRAVANSQREVVRPIEAQEVRAPVEPPAEVPTELVVPSPPDLFQIGDLVPVERWIFGQENRVFPAKVNARIFLNLLKETGNPREIGEIAEAISRAATSVYVHLRALDERHNHNKDDSLAIGFPEPDSHKSIARYANQFVAYENTQGRLSGMLIEWKLVGVKRVKNKTYLYPTSAGIRFARLPNPLLDSSEDGESPKKFSEDEIAWALSHVATALPVEYSAFCTIVRGIQSGANTPELLDRYIRSNAGDKADISDEFVSTQRSGALSRMVDIALTRRVRKGTRIMYELTERAQEWIQQNNNNTPK